MRRAALVLLAALAGAGCGDGGDGDGDAGGSEAELRIRYEDGGGVVRRATLSCGSGVSATEWLADRDPEGLCRTARELAGFLASKPDPNAACTQIYGGPDTARVRGSVDGRRIDRSFTREDGCAIADWDRAQPLLPEPAGAGGELR